MSLQDAARLVQNDQTLALGGMTLYRRPVAFVQALLTAQPRDLTLLAFTAGYAADLLVGAGCVRAVRTAYFGLEVFGLAPNFTRLANEIQVIEESEASIVLGLRAAIAGVGYLPSRAWQGTDLHALRPDVKTVVDPYSGDELTAFPAIPLDVAVIHALEADRHGNIALNNNLAIDQTLIYAADVVIATFDRTVDQVEWSVDRTIIPAPGIDVLVHAPDGAWPTSCYPLYPMAAGEFLRYTEKATDAEGFKQYLKLLSVI